MTSDNAGDNITITGEGSTLKINATGGSGEAEAKTWVCAIIQDSPECAFFQLREHFDAGLQQDIESMHAYHNTKGIIKFTEEKSLIEVNKRLMFEAKMTADGDYIIANDPSMFTGYTPFAVCPWPEDKPWPESN